MNKGMRKFFLVINFIIIIGVSIWLGWVLSNKTNEDRNVDSQGKPITLNY